MNDITIIAASSANEAAAIDGADWTIREIAQQPAMWQRTLADLDPLGAEIEAWLKPVLAKPGLRVILTGAGTSAYAGTMLVPALTRVLDLPVEAIATTDIVSNPQQFLLPDAPTLMISFARSGSSPESVAAVELVEALVADPHHLVLCCNGESELVDFANNAARDARCLVMPAETLDRSFAMTSSITSMVLSVLALFAPDASQTAMLETVVKKLLAEPADGLHALVGDGLKRVIFLGSGGLFGTAREAALKCLELSAGKTTAVAETSLGLRHGPKFAVDQDTLIVVFTSHDPYTRRYDQDIAAELERDGVARHVIRLGQIAPFADTALEDAWLGLAYLVWAQLLAYHNAIALGISPDNPSPSGEINRVVKGVIIHPIDSARQ